jgi:RNA polymerase sigma-70 factor (ECF subfamily)
MLTGVAPGAINNPAEMERLYAESGALRFSISREEFSAMLLGTSPANDQRVKELVLAKACAKGNDQAWDYFLVQYREKLYTAAAAIARDDAQGRELADSLYAELFGTRTKEDGRRVSKLESFQGRGSLEGWLRTLLAQEYVNRFRSRRRQVVFDDTLEAPGQTAARDPGAELQQQMLAKATDEALVSLRDEERFLLAAYYLDERSLAEIGRMAGTHESTVSRRLEKITAGLRKDILKRLSKAGVAKRAAEEMLEVDVRDLSVNVRETLAQERRG